MEDQKHKKGYNLPKGYFEEFEDRLFNRINSDIIPKESGFKTPEGYFIEVEKNIIQQCNNQQKTKVIPIVSRKTMLYAASIAACAILIFSIFGKDQDTISINNIDITSIENYINEGNVELNQYDLSSLLTEEDLSNITIEENHIPEDIIEAYLLEDINDSSILIE